MHNRLLWTESLSKKYSDEDGYVLTDLNFSLGYKQKIALLGQSGCGKSTLLHLLCLLDTPTSGSIYFRNMIINTLNDKEKTSLRGKHFGFVFQFHNLLEEFTALENVCIPQILAGISKTTAVNQGKYLLSLFGLEAKHNARPSQLSGGQRQRVAIARAVANSPDVLLADEPTGSLDESTSMIVMNELLEILDKLEISAVIATHNEKLAQMMDDKIYM